MRRFAYWHEVVLAALLIALLGGAYSVSPRFMNADVQKELASHAWTIAVLALPMTMIIITGGIDLSVGSTMSLSAVVLGLLIERGCTMSLAIPAALLTGALAGALNGLFIAGLRVHPLIVTLATLSAYRGIAEGISHARPLSGFPAGFATLSQQPWPALIFACGLALTAFVLNKTVLGRYLYAIGHNETACRFSGVPVNRIKLRIYTLSGLAAAVAALLFVSLRNTAKADIGDGIELDVITAVVLGGTSIFGGRGGMIGTLLGLALIHETREFVSWYWQNDVLILIVVGALLIASVLLNTLLTPRGR